MRIRDREFWTLIHGMGFGTAYLLAFAGGRAGWPYKPSITYYLSLLHPHHKIIQPMCVIQTAPAVSICPGWL